MGVYVFSGHRAGTQIGWGALTAQHLWWVRLWSKGSRARNPYPPLKISENSGVHIYPRFNLCFVCAC